MTLKSVPPPMIYVAHEFLDQLFWKLHRILDKEGVSVLQWAIMLRSYLDEGGVSYSAIRKATGHPLDNVRRAAEFLQASKLGKVIVDPKDKRARIFILNKRGKDRTRCVNEAFKADLLVAVGAREIFSKRAQQFTRHMWHASIYLASGDVASKELDDDRIDNRAAVPDNSLRYVELPKQARAPFLIDLEKVPF
jgi:DNA-binding MarR family transcriptional regulator